MRDVYRCLQTKRAARLSLFTTHLCVYIYDLLKYNENIRAGRGLTLQFYFVLQNAPRVFLFKIGFHDVRRARIIIHFAGRPLAKHNTILYIYYIFYIIMYAQRRDDDDNSRRLKRLFSPPSIPNCQN